MIAIRDMTESDAQIMSDIDAEIFSMSWSKESFQQSLKNEYTSFIVAADNEKIIGYCGAYKSFDEGHITNLAVVEEYRRQGVAKKLLSSMFETLKNDGIVNVTLEVRKSNQAAIDLYTSFGFKTVGVRANFYEHPTEGAIIMWKYGI